MCGTVVDDAALSKHTVVAKGSSNCFSRSVTTRALPAAEVFCLRTQQHLLPTLSQFRGAVTLQSRDVAQLVKPTATRVANCGELAPNRERSHGTRGNSKHAPDVSRREKWGGVHGHPLSLKTDSRLADTPRGTRNSAKVSPIRDARQFPLNLLDFLNVGVRPDRHVRGVSLGDAAIFVPLLDICADNSTNTTGHPGLVSYFGVPSRVAVGLFTMEDFNILSQKSFTNANCAESRFLPMESSRWTLIQARNDRFLNLQKRFPKHLLRTANNCTGITLTLSPRHLVWPVSFDAAINKRGNCHRGLRFTCRSCRLRDET